MGKKRKKVWRAAPYAFSGLFGRKEIVGCLKMRGGWFKGSNSLSFVIFGCGANCIWFLVLFPLLTLWIGWVWVKGGCFLVSPFVFCVASRNSFVYFLYFGTLLLTFLFYKLLLFIEQKKKKNANKKGFELCFHITQEVTFCFFFFEL